MGEIWRDESLARLQGGYIRPGEECGPGVAISRPSRHFQEQTADLVILARGQPDRRRVDVEAGGPFISIGIGAKRRIEGEILRQRICREEAGPVLCAVIPAERDEDPGRVHLGSRRETRGIQHLRLGAVRHIARKFGRQFGDRSPKDHGIAAEGRVAYLARRDERLPFRVAFRNGVGLGQAGRRSRHEDQRDGLLQHGFATTGAPLLGCFNCRPEFGFL